MKYCVYERIMAACQSGHGVRLSCDECCELYHGDQSFRVTAENRRHARISATRHHTICDDSIETMGTHDA